MTADGSHSHLSGQPAQKDPGLEHGVAPATATATGMGMGMGTTTQRWSTTWP